MGKRLQKELVILSDPAPLAENPYQRLLYAACSDAGARLLDGDSGIERGLLRNPGARKVLHVHWIWLKTGAIARLLRAARVIVRLGLAKALGWTIVATVHNLEPHDAKGLDRAVNRALRAASDGFICHTLAARDRLQTVLRRRRPMAVIPHGHYIDAYPGAPDRATARAALCVPAGVKLFLFLGQVRPYKGVPELCRAFRDLEGSAQLLIAGRAADPAHAAEVRAAIGGDPRIRFDDRRLADAELGLHFAAADAAVLPFREVTTSGSLLLALSFGCPAILPQSSCLAEVADGKAALHYEDGELAAALAAVCSSPELLDRKAAKAAAERADWRTIGALTAAYFAELVTLHRRG